MARATIKLKRPITQLELDVDENSLEAVGFIRMPKAKTNADRIRGMSNEELAEYHTEMCGCPPGHDPIFCGMATIGCKGCWLNWLKGEVSLDG